MGEYNILGKRSQHAFCKKETIVNKTQKILKSTWPMEMPIKLLTQFSKFFSNISQKKLKPD